MSKKIQKENFKFFEEKNLKEKNKKKEEKDIREKETIFQFKKKQIEIKVDAETELLKLKKLVIEGIISEKTAENIFKGKNLNKEEIEKMFEKIEEIKSIKNIERYLPEDLIINTKEYI